MSTQFHTPAELSQALNQLVPAMGDHGLTIQAGGHSITLPPGRLACRISDELAQALRLELMRHGVRSQVEHFA